MAREKQGSPAGEKKLEQYGVWVKVKPQEVVETATLEESSGLSDLESPKATAVAAMPSTDESSLTAEEEQLLDELETELGPEGASSDVRVPEEEPLLEEEGELPDIESAAGPRDRGAAPEQPPEEELPMLEEEPPARARKAGESGEVEVTLSEGAVEEDRFDDLQALESDLATVASTPGASAAPSAQVLARIEEELRSIRTDLAKLRGELSGLQKGARKPAAEQPAAGAAKEGGFFDEDEDETIALTGDELDNILNTADITEESAETPIPEAAPGPQAAAETPAADVLEQDILSYETPALEEDRLPPADGSAKPASKAAPPEDTLVLGDEAYLPSAEAAEGEPGSASLEELPAELELEDLAGNAAALRPSAALEDLPVLDLEGIPEIETAEAPPAAGAGKKPAKPGAAKKGQEEEGRETIDLETLDLGEEPKVIEAVPEQVDELEAIPEAEPVEDEKPSGGNALAEEVDLEALAAEAEELEDEAPVAASADLEIGELESVGEEEAGPRVPEKEMVKGTPAEKAPAAGKKQETGPAGVPENLKDEIRTVLKYMDTLLEALPDEKIKEFASSDYFVMYKKLFEDLGLGE